MTTPSAKAMEKARELLLGMIGCCDICRFESGCGCIDSISAALDAFAAEARARERDWWEAFLRSDLSPDLAEDVIQNADAAVIREQP